MQCNCMMGVFPEISRAWLTIDNDIFMWNYEDGCVLHKFTFSAVALLIHYRDRLKKNYICTVLTFWSFSVVMWHILMVWLKPSCQWVLWNQSQVTPNIKPQTCVPVFLLESLLRFPLFFSGIFQPNIHYLLVLATPVDVVILGLSFPKGHTGEKSDQSSIRPVHCNIGYFLWFCWLC